MKFIQLKLHLIEPSGIKLVNKFNCIQLESEYNLVLTRCSVDRAKRNYPKFFIILSHTSPWDFTRWFVKLVDSIASSVVSLSARSMRFPTVPSSWRNPFPCNRVGKSSKMDTFVERQNPVRRWQHWADLILIWLSSISHQASSATLELGSSWMLDTRSGWLKWSQRKTPRI